MPASLAIRHLRARAPAHAQPVAARLALQVLGAELEDALPRSLPPQALLWVRRLALQAPEAALLRPAPLAWRRDWVAAGRERLDTALAQAARPALGAVPADAPAVLFADEGEMLACLALAAHGGQLDRWWWRGLLGRAWPAWQSAWAARPQACGPAQRLLARAGQGGAAGWTVDEPVGERAAPPATEARTAQLAQAGHVAIHGRTEGSGEQIATPAVAAEGRRAAPVVAEAPTAGMAGDSAPPWVADAAALQPGAPQALVHERALLAAAEAARTSDATPALAPSAREQPVAREIVPIEDGKPAVVSASVEMRAVQAVSPHDTAAWPAKPVRRATLLGDAPHKSPLPAETAPASETGPHQLQPAPPLPTAAYGKRTPPRRALAPAEPPDQAPDLPPLATPAPQPLPAQTEAAPAADVAPWPWPQALQSRQAPLLFLVNLLLEDGLYPDFTRPRDPGLPVPLWALLAALAQAWRLPADPLHAALTARDGPWDEAVLLPAAPGVPEGPWRQWLPAFARSLRHRVCRRLGLRGAQWARALTLPHPAQLWLSEAEWVACYELGAHDVAWRLAGLDRDPGWLPSAGCSLRFEFR